MMQIYMIPKIFHNPFPEEYGFHNTSDKGMALEFGITWNLTL